MIPHYHFPGGSYNNHIQEKKRKEVRKREEGKKSQMHIHIQSKIVIVPRSAPKDILTLTPALPPNNQRNRATHPLNSALETPS